MKLPDEIINRIQQFITFDLNTSLGCTLLARKINETLHEYISANTLKRTFGIIESSSKPSATTLDLIARYIGYADWENFINDDKTQTSDFSDNEILSLNEIPIGTDIRWGYSPNRNITMKCIAPCRFVITESFNSKLLVDDIVTAYQIVKGHQMEFSSVIRNDIEFGAFSAGIHDGITFFEVL